MAQGWSEKKDIRTDKAPKHQEVANKSKQISFSNAEILPAKSGKWNDEFIIRELRIIIKNLGCFPTQNQLEKMKRSDLSSAIKSCGGYSKFQALLGFEPKLTMWTDELIISELESIINKTGKFPTQTELQKMKKTGLISAISKHGGFPKFQKILGYEVKHRTWNDRIILVELKEIIKELDYFPSATDLKRMNKKRLLDAITRYGGIVKFQKILGYKSKLVTRSKEDIISELKVIDEELTHFPSATELEKMKKYGLASAITKHGGYPKFQELLGYTISLQEKYKSQLASYIGKRGRVSENIVKEIIIEWSEIHGKPEPNLNIKLAKGNVIEFVCDANKRIGIDVTNTKSSKASIIHTISRKWKHKHYHLHLDELWIVVFTNVLSSEDYNILNQKSPNNVKIFSIEGFLNELDYSTEKCDMKKINNYKNCSFHNKEKLKNRN